MTPKQEAVAAGEKTYHTGEPCRRGHFSARYLSGHCVRCRREAENTLRASKSDEVNAARRGYYARNKEAVLLREARRRRERPEVFKAKDQRWYARNRNQKAQSVAEWGQRNPHKVLARNSKYRASKIRRTPLWLGAGHLAEIESFYAEAVRLTVETENSHEVDHIVPLCGQNVSGLHVPWNLQVLTATENRQKYNTV